jgi:hypothetical protein
MFMKVYVVYWAAASKNNEGSLSAFSHVSGVYAFEDDAKKGLESCKQDFLTSILENSDLDEAEKERVKANTHVYGSVEDDYFKIEYLDGDNPCEIYISLVEKEIQG